MVPITSSEGSAGEELPISTPALELRADFGFPGLMKAWVDKFRRKYILEKSCSLGRRHEIFFVKTEIV